MPAKDRTFRPTTDAAYKDELSERRKTGNFKNVVGDDPVAVIVKAQIELTVDAATSDRRLRGRPVNRAHLGKLLDFVVANQYRLGWEMVPEEKRRGRPVEKKDIYHDSLRSRQSVRVPPCGAVQLGFFICSCVAAAS